MTWDHLACESVGVNIFRHLQAQRMINFYKLIIKSENKPIMSLKYYVNCVSFIRKNIAEIFFRYYDVTNVFYSDRSAKMSSIDYGERNEPRRSFLSIILIFLEKFIYFLSGHIILVSGKDMNWSHLNIA